MLQIKTEALSLGKENVPAPTSFRTAQPLHCGLPVVSTFERHQHIFAAGVLAAHSL